MIHFAYPYAMLLFLVIAGVVAFLKWQKRRHLLVHSPFALPFSQVALLKESGRGGVWCWLAGKKEWLFWFALSLLVVAIARPQQTIASWPVWGEGIDIALVLDTSSSMLQSDLKPNRMVVAKKRLFQFIHFRRQKEDRLGLILFAKRAFTLCPLTTDQKMLGEMLQKVQTGVIADDTALGDALATALARLRHSKRRQRAILLVTDGENNAGQVHPLTAAELAKKMRVPIFPLLIGRSISSNDTGTTELTPWRVLQKVASLSQGSAYHATDPKKFQKALLTILDQMTPTRMQKPRFYTVRKELFSFFLLPALFLLVLLWLLEATRLRSIP